MKNPTILLGNPPHRIKRKYKKRKYSSFDDDESSLSPPFLKKPKERIRQQLAKLDKLEGKHKRKKADKEDRGGIKFIKGQPKGEAVQRQGAVIEYFRHLKGKKDTQSDMFKWVDGSNVLEDLQLQLLKKDTLIAEMEFRKEMKDEKIKKLEMKNENLEEEMQGMKAELSEMRIEKMLGCKNEKNMLIGLTISWIFFVFVYLIKNQC